MSYVPGGCVLQSPIEKFIKEYFEGYEWVGSGRSGLNGAEWRIALDIPALRERLLKVVYEYKDSQNQILPHCPKHNEEMILSFYDRPGSPPGNGWVCQSCVKERS